MVGAICGPLLAPATTTAKCASPRHQVRRKAPGPRPCMNRRGEVRSAVDPITPSRCPPSYSNYPAPSPRRLRQRAGDRSPAIRGPAPFLTDGARRSTSPTPYPNPDRRGPMSPPKSNRSPPSAQAAAASPRTWRRGGPHTSRPDPPTASRSPGSRRSIPTGRNHGPRSARATATSTTRNGPSTTRPSQRASRPGRYSCGGRMPDAGRGRPLRAALTARVECPA